MDEEEFKERLEKIISRGDDCFRYIFTCFSNDFLNCPRTQLKNGAIPFWEEDLQSYLKTCVFGMFREISIEVEKYEKQNLGGSYDPKSE